MSDALEFAEGAIGDVAEQLGVKVDPKMVAQLAGFVVGAIASQKTWEEAAHAGLARAALVKDVASAEAAAVERNR